MTAIKVSSALKEAMSFSIPVLLLAAFCQQTLASEHWSYFDTSQWGDTCQHGAIQSPIDIKAANTTQQGTTRVAVNYTRSAELSTEQNSHGRQQILVPPGSTLTVNDIQYPLLSIHWHTPSEHALNGTHGLAEMHIVHQNSTGGAAVVGVLYEQGSKPDELVQLFLDNLPPFAEQGVHSDGPSFGPVDLSAVIGAAVPNGDSGHYWTYTGSLTTPPCTEGVVWLVSTVPSQISNLQVIYLEWAFGGGTTLATNARPLQSVSSDQQVQTTK